jgi:GNAT superfamily N-acetyltransferase
VRLIYLRVDDRVVIHTLKDLTSLTLSADWQLMEFGEALEAGLVRNLGFEKIREFQNRRHHARSIVAVKNNQCCGYLWLTSERRTQEGEEPFFYSINPNSSECYIFDFYIDPSCRGSGLGVVMMQECLKLAKSLKYKQVFLTHDRLNEAMERLTNRLKFRSIGSVSYTRVLGVSWKDLAALRHLGVAAV